LGYAYTLIQINLAPRNIVRSIQMPKMRNGKQQRTRHAMRRCDAP